MNHRRVCAAVVCLCGVLAVSRVAAAADQVIFVVRHAERADGGAGATPGAMTAANDPPLSAAGTARAKRLAGMLASADVKHIFTTEFQRTRDTGAPLAEKAGITSVVVSSRDSPSLLRQVRAANGNALIVGHSNTVPELLKQLGVTPDIAITDDEYDNLFVVVRPAAGPPSLIRLRY